MLSSILTPRHHCFTQHHLPSKLLLPTCQRYKRVQSSAMSFRHYDPATDHAQVVEICKDVYDGTDFMPAAVNRYAASDVTTVLVVEAADGSSGIDGLVCAEPRGGVLWVFGVRVRASRRGAGVGTQLLNAALDLGRRMGLRGALSVTIGDNAGMRRVFERAGMAQRDRVDVWPCRRLQRGAERARREAGGGLPATVDDLAPGWADVLLQAPPNNGGGGGAGGSSRGCGGGDVRRLLSRWRRCRSVAELQAAVEGLQRKQQQGRQQHQAQQSGGQGGHSSPPIATETATASGQQPPQQQQQLEHQRGEAADSDALLPAWVPHVYAACPVDWDCVGQWVEEGHIWILPGAEGSDDSSINDAAATAAAGAAAAAAAAAAGDAVGGGSGSGSSSSLAILALVPSPDLSGCYAAGIRAASTAATEAALLHARALQPAFRAYLQCIGCEPPAALYEATGPADDFLVYYKPL